MKAFLDPTSSTSSSAPPPILGAATVSTTNKKDDDNILTNSKEANKILETHYNVINDDAFYCDWNRTFIRTAKCNGWSG